MTRTYLIRVTVTGELADCSGEWTEDAFLYAFHRAFPMSYMDDWDVELISASHEEDENA